jgi:hypothetical protein
MLALIGPEWLNARDDQGQRRLDSSDDWVQLEIAHALNRGITVIPVRVNATGLPPKAMLPEDIKGLLDHQAVSVSTSSFRSDMAGLAKDIRSIPNPWLWRRFASIAAGLALFLVAGLVLGQVLGFSNVVQRIQSALWAKTSGSAKLNSIWNGRAGEWVLYGYTDKGIGYFFQSSSIKTLGDTAVYTARFPVQTTNTTSDKAPPQPTYEDDVTLVHCKKSLSAMMERTVYSQSGEIVSHFKRGDPKSFDLFSGGAPITPGSLLATAQRVMCDEQLRTPLLRQISEMTSYLSPAPTGDGDIFYGPMRTVSNSDYQLEVSTYLRYYQDLMPSEMFAGKTVTGAELGFRTFAQILQMNCQERKIRSIRLEYYDAEGNLITLIVPIQAEPLAVTPTSPLELMLKVACGENVGGTYEGMNSAVYERGGQGEQKITVTVKQTGNHVDVSFATASGDQGKGSGTLSGSVVEPLTLESTAPACPGSYQGALKFSDNGMSWSYKGQDCGGSMEGQGTAKRTRT